MTAHNADVVPLFLSAFMFAKVMLLCMSASSQCTAFAYGTVIAKYVRGLNVTDIQPGPKLSIGTARACRSLRSDAKEI